MDMHFDKKPGARGDVKVLRYFGYGITQIFFLWTNDTPCIYTSNVLDRLITSQLSNQSIILPLAQWLIRHSL